MIAVVCDSPYQLISAIMVAGQIAPGEKIVFLINRFHSSKNYNFNYGDKHPLTEKILYYDRSHMSYAKLLRGLYSPNHMLKSIDGYNLDYDFSAIIAPRTAYMATYIKKAAQRRKKDIPVYIIEEGADEYINEFKDTRFTRACRALMQKTHIDDVAGAYLSAPELYPFKLNFPIEKVPPIDSVSSEIITSVFNLEEINANNPLDRYKYIFLSQPMSRIMKNANDAILCDANESKLADITVKYAGYENTVLKVHPLDEDYQKDGVNLYRSKLPIESLMLSLDANSKFFISVFSTCMLTPKMLFDYEPGLIFTYKIFEPFFLKNGYDEKEQNRCYAFIKDIISTYSNPDICAIPKTIDEYEDMIKRFSSAYNL